MNQVSDNISFGVPIAKHSDNGLYLPSGQMYFINRETVKEEHARVEGKPGSGKSATVIADHALQRLSEYDISCADSGQVLHKNVRDSVVIVDLGGDPSLFYTAKHAAEINNRNFWPISTDFSHSCFFDLFQNLPNRSNKHIRLSNVLMAGFNLDGGLGGGDQYFSFCNLSAFHAAAHTVIDRRGRGENVGLKEIYQLLAQRKSRDEQQVRMMVELMLQYPQLLPPQGAKPLVDVMDALNNGDVIYFFCPTLGEGTTARIVASLGLQTVLNAAVLRKNFHNHTWIFVDEFQEIVGTELAKALAQCRKFGVSLFLANQDRDQLKNKYVDLRPIVENACGIKMYFTPTTKEDIDDLLEKSMDAIHNLHGTTYGQSTSHRSQPYIGRILQRNEILQIAKRKRSCFLVDNTTGLHVEPIPVETNFVVSPQFHADHKHKEPPIVAKTVPKPPTPQPPQQSSSNVSKTSNKSHNSAAQKVLAKKRAARKPQKDT